jgi:hypothetical protein
MADQPKNPTDLAPAPWRSRGATNGADVLALAAADHDAGIPATYTVATPSGGQHLYYRQPTGHQLGNSAGRIGWKIDTRGHGGYVVGAGSITSHGPYQATTTTTPQPLPSWIADALDAGTPYPGPTGTVPELKNTSAYALAALAGESSANRTVTLRCSGYVGFSGQPDLDRHQADRGPVGADPCGRGPAGRRRPRLPEPRIVRRPRLPRTPRGQRDRAEYSWSPGPGRTCA